MIRCLLVSILICLSLASCQKKDAAAKIPDQCLRLNISTDPTTFDPRKGGDLTSSVFHFLLFDGLIRYNENGEFIPSLAESISISEDKKVYTFHICEAFWSDGTPITAWDFEKSWKDILNPDFPALNAHLLYPIKNAENYKRGKSCSSEVGIHSLDAKTLEVTLEHPVPYFLQLISFCVFYPVNAEMDQSEPNWDRSGNKNFICSGPFILKEWKPNNLIILKKNPNYFLSNHILLEEIHLNVIDNEMTSLQMFEKGEIDILGQPIIPIPTDAIPELMKTEKIIIHPVPATTFCSFNVTHYPFTNVNIRKAFAYAINRKQIVSNVTQLQEIPALNLVAPALNKNKLSLTYFCDDDKENAQALFQQGIKELNISMDEFPTIKLTYSSTEGQHKLAQTIQNQWQDTLGVKIQLEAVDKKNLIHKLKSRKYETALSFWMAQYNDPMNILERFKYSENAKNYPNWQNQEYIKQIHLSFEAGSDGERQNYLNEAEKIFLDEMPLAPIYHWNSAYIVKPYVKSLGTLPIMNSNFDRVYIDVKTKNSINSN